MTVSCMGGWGCHKRNSCAHHLALDRSLPVERLCEHGLLDAYVPLPQHVVRWAPKPVGTGEPTAKAAA